MPINDNWPIAFGGTTYQPWFTLPGTATALRYSTPRQECADADRAADEQIAGLLAEIQRLRAFIAGAGMLGALETLDDEEEDSGAAA